MKVYDFTSYQEYKDKNTEINIKKELTAAFMPFKYDPVIQYIKKTGVKPTLGLCHGARNDKEHKYFASQLNCEVIGTDISHTANKYPGMIEWDFHNVKEEWLDNVDFIYSNSTDHSHSPRYCFYQWVRCLKPTGHVFVEWDTDKFLAGFNAADCFGATFEEYYNLFQEMGVYKEHFRIDGSRSIFVLKKVPVSYDDIKHLNTFGDKS